MREQLEKLRDEAIRAIAAVSSEEALQEIRVRFLGRKGELTALMKGVGVLSPEERPIIGQLVNTIKEEVEASLDAALETTRETARSRRLQSERIDVTLPGRHPANGTKHPISLVIEEVCDIFAGLGFSVAEGPEIEQDWYNFEALNFPPEHPARDMQDTFFVENDLLLRTHTSPVQIRTMLKQKPPVRIIAPGTVYRCDSDATHSPMFHQIEGLMVDQGITFGDLKGILTIFTNQLFGQKTGVRLRPSFFPFTEPSAEVDIGCVICKGAGCGVCKRTGWLEILGSGTVHPQLFRNVGYDPEEVSGFAFGMGVERIAMVKFGIDDIKQFYYNDIRFLSQF
jgi:phenylalanyl-tRNA synthetase alpha chain